MKLRMLNGTHSSLAYLGYLAGHETIAETVADPVFAAFCRHLWRRRSCRRSRRRKASICGSMPRQLLRALRQPGDPSPHLADRHGRQPEAAAAHPRHPRRQPRRRPAEPRADARGRRLDALRRRHRRARPADRRPRPAGRPAEGAVRRRQATRPRRSRRCCRSARSSPRATPTTHCAPGSPRPTDGSPSRARAPARPLSPALAKVETRLRRAIKSLDFSRLREVSRVRKSPGDRLGQASGGAPEGCRICPSTNPVAAALPSCRRHAFGVTAAAIPRPPGRPRPDWHWPGCRPAPRPPRWRSGRPDRAARHRPRFRDPGAPPPQGRSEAIGRDCMRRQEANCLIEGDVFADEGVGDGNEASPGGDDGDLRRLSASRMA